MAERGDYQAVGDGRDFDAHKWLTKFDDNGGEKWRRITWNMGGGLHGMWGEMGG